MLLNREAKQADIVCSYPGSSIVNIVEQTAPPTQPDPYARAEERPAVRTSASDVKRYTARFIAGLVAIALAAIAGTTVTYVVLDRQEADTRAFAAAAALSSATIQLKAVLGSSGDAADILALDAIGDDLADTYLGLQFGNEQQGLSAADTDKLLHLYIDADPAFYALISALSDATNEGTNLGDDERATLAAQADVLSARVESIVSEYERLAEARTENLKKTQLLLLEGILVLVLILAVFLFRPAARKLREGVVERELIHARQRQSDKEQVEYLAQFDPLTGLANRVLFRDRLEHALERAKREDGLVTVMFLDLDEFKSINDRFGHHIGDQLLKQVAARLVETVRDSDTVARLGGDEFTVIMEGQQRPEDAAIVADKILTKLTEPLLLMGRELHVSASIGIVVYPIDGGTIDTLLQDADLAMYSAKQAGKNTFQFFTQQLKTQSSERLEILDDLRKALRADDQLWMAYQPIVDAETGEVAAVEALLRWDHPTKGEIPPGLFIPVVEETSLIGELGDWVINRVFRQARDWSMGGLGHLMVTFNVSARQFSVGDLVETIKNALNRSGADPTHLELEITESSLLHDRAEATAILHKLKDLGLRISIDDFGTGYSSLSYLGELPLDCLKVDRQFVTDLDSSDETSAIPAAVIKLAHALGLSAIAEGVETTEQLHRLKELDCDLLQGYLISRPVRPEKIGEMVQVKDPVPLKIYR